MNGVNLTIEGRADELMREDLGEIHRRTDRLFACLMVVQWLAGIGAALWISPTSWSGAQSSMHIHVWAAVFLGGAIASLPIVLALARPRETMTRHVVAAAQMLMSALLIHLTGGRIETHFHVFGSLALLAAYRDWRVLLTSTFVVALDHAIRGAVWPESVYGVLTAAPWRTLEHAGWVIFEDIFLLATMRQSLAEMRRIAHQRAMLESTHRITEETVQRRTMELQLAESRTRLIVESAPNGILMIDESQSIVDMNPKIEEMFGYSSDELVGSPITVLFPERSPKQHPEFWKNFIDSPESFSIGGGRDLHGVTKSGKNLPVELRLNPLRTDDGLFVFASFVDITERKLAELELQRYAAQLEAVNDELIGAQKELTQKNQDLDEFTYVASHDLQEPVRKLISFSELLKVDSGEDLNEQARRDLTFIVDAASRMRQLVQDLLALSRIGRSAMKSELTSLENCHRLATDALQLRIDETSAVVEADELPQVVGDHSTLTQLYQNLIGNALKFVTDREPRITLTVDGDEDYWILGVRDNGIGIEPEYAEQIFKPFQRLHRRDQYDGTGIGLAICKKTVDRHGGKLWVESVPGEGSHFKFTIPKGPRKEACTETKPAQEELLSC